MLRSSQVTVSTTAVTLLPSIADDARIDFSVTYVNNGSVSVFIGASGVTASTGMELKPGAAISLTLTGEIPFGITSSGSGRIDVLASGVA